MKTLSETWFAEGYIDFELKKYVLLAYLQQVNRFYHENKIYPQLADVIFHYNNLVAFKENKESLKNQFPKRLTGIQMEKLQLLYEEMIADDEIMEELAQIVHYATSQLKNTIDSGQEIYDFVEDKLEIQPIGIIPLYLNEGYFILRNGDTASSKVYQYRLSIFERHSEKYRSLQSNYVDEWENNMVNTFDSIKYSLIKQNKDLPNPAVYAITTNFTFPLEETLLPVAKRSLVRVISEA
jgi:hypothetical protein